MESSREIETRAAQWLAKRDSGNWTDEDQAQLTRWLESSLAHHVAFIRLEHGWQECLRLNALGAGSTSGAVPPRGFWKEPLASRFRDRGARAAGTRSSRPGRSSALRSTRIAFAASVLVAVAGSFGWYLSTRSHDYRTPIGGLASVPMTDGSKITLNTASAVDVAVTENERTVRLKRGEAFFEVAKDPSRPFVVVAGDKRVIAVGTKFSVRRRDDDIQVFVTEGQVRIESLVQQRLATTGNPGSGEAIISAGSIARAGGEGIVVEQSSPADVEDYVSWRTGFLVFTSTPLAEAVAEFNRYNEDQISIKDATLGSVLVSGKFRPTNFEGFVRLLESGHSIRVEHSAGSIVLSERRAEN